MRPVNLLDDLSTSDLTIETRPTAVRVKFHVRCKQLIATSCTVIYPFVVCEIILTDEWSVRSFFTKDIVLFR